MKLITSICVGGYEWSTFGVYKHPTVPGKYAVSTQGGCSCNGWENLSRSEARAKTPMTKMEVRNHFSKWWDGLSDYKISESSMTKVAGLEKLSTTLI